MSAANKPCTKLVCDNDTTMGFVSKAKFSLVAFLVLLTPLIFSSNTGELYEFPKMFLVYAVGITCTFVFMAGLLFYPQKLVRPPFVITLFVVSFVVSTALSSHFYTSVWGYYSRFNGGLISVLVFFGLYLVIINSFSRDDLAKLLDVTVLSVIPVSIYAILQFISAGGVDRVYSTLGQPNWLAAYLVIMMPFIVNKILSSTSSASSALTKSLTKETLLWSAVFLLVFSALWFTYSMSGLLGLVVGMGAFCLFNWERVKASVSVLVILSVVAVLIAGLNLGFFRQRVSDVFLDLSGFVGYHYSGRAYADESSQMPPQISQNHQISDPGFIRKGLWTGTLDLIFSGPKVFLIGTGPETFPYVFQPFRPSELNYSSEWDFILNKPHNYYLEIFSQNGAIGLLAYAALIWWTLRKKHRLITPALIGFYVTNLFGWPTVSTNLLFWLFLAML